LRMSRRSSTSRARGPRYERLRLFPDEPYVPSACSPGARSSNGSPLGVSHYVKSSIYNLHLLLYKTGEPGSRGAGKPGGKAGKPESRRAGIPSAVAGSPVPRLPSSPTGSPAPRLTGSPVRQSIIGFPSMSTRRSPTISAAGRRTCFVVSRYLTVTVPSFSVS